MTPIDRDDAAELARRELEQPIYHRDDPSLIGRILDRIGEWLDRLFPGDASDPGQTGGGDGPIGVIIVVGLLVAAVVLVVWVMRGRRNLGSTRAPLLEERPSSADEHRDAAERYAAAGQWPQAIRERLRAIARDLEERVILDPRPGRTAQELAVEAGAALPDHAAQLRGCAALFDDVWYGDRSGTAEGYQRITELAQRLRDARPGPLTERDAERPRDPHEHGEQYEPYEQGGEHAEREARGRAGAGGATPTESTESTERRPW